MPISDPQLRRLRAIAYHEAGHAVASLVMGQRIKHVTIVPSEDSAGLCQGLGIPKWFSPDVGIDTRHEKWMERQILIMLAGIAAGHRHDGKNRWKGAGPDFHSAINLASYMYDGRILEKYISFMLERVRAFVSARFNWLQIEAVAWALLERRTLSSKDVRRVCREGRGRGTAVESLQDAPLAQPMK